MTVLIQKQKYKFCAMKIVLNAVAYLGGKSFVIAFTSAVYLPNCFGRETAKKTFGL